jgi:hypothetical protein
MSFLAIGVCFLVRRRLRKKAGFQRHDSDQSRFDKPELNGDGRPNLQQIEAVHGESRELEAGERSHEVAVKDVTTSELLGIKPVELP